jgi:AraC-like DNA-binding protein
MRARAEFMLYRSKMDVDPLSDMLALLKPRNIACGAVDAGDGCLAFPAGNGIKCHAVAAGKASLAIDGEADVIDLAAGDAVILPRGRPYRLASDLGLSPTDYRAALVGRLPGQLTTWNGGGRVTIITAAFALDERHAGVLRDILPAVAPVVGGDARIALAQSLRQMMAELHAPQPGGRLVVQHLATTLLVQALRTYLAQEGRDRVGWLFALEDKQLGTAIGAMHAEPAREWTVQSLAETAGMSRTNFAVRFRSAVGSSPIAYLTNLRLRLASDRLTTSGNTISAVAEAFGYASESAFSHAFKRHMGHSPRHFAKSGPQRSLLPQRSIPDVASQDDDVVFLNSRRARPEPSNR